MVVMDHTHAFSDNSELTGRIDQLAYTRDTKIFGAFPEFYSYWDEKHTATALAKLDTCTDSQVAPFIDSIPNGWQVDTTARSSLMNFVVDRAHWLATRQPVVFKPQI
jgi:hypothetical protein